MAKFGSQFDGGGRGWGGGDSRPPWWRRLMAQGDNPFFWSVPFGRLAGISLHISLIYVVWMVIELVPGARGSWTFKASYVGSLFVLVLLHELGHCFACRSVGGEADRILMWMLGGLAYCRSPHNWRANFITTAGGPMVNVVLVPVFAGVLLAVGVPLKALVFNPLWGSGLADAWGTAIAAMKGGGVPEWLRTPLFTLYFTNLALLLFNVLLPMFPMDGGRLLQTLLWRKIGYTRSMWAATTVGLACALVVGLFGVATGQFTYIGLAVMAGVTCFQQRQQLRFMGAEMEQDERFSQWGADGEGWKVGGGMGGGGAGLGKSVKVHNPRKQEKARKAAEAEHARAVADSAELDRILAKIKEKGMASLTRGEDAFLRRSTERSKGSGKG